jgi:hypothetical protein
MMYSTHNVNCEQLGEGAQGNTRLYALRATVFLEGITAESLSGTNEDLILGRFLEAESTYRFSLAEITLVMLLLNIVRAHTVHMSVGPHGGGSIANLHQLFAR